MTQTPTSEMQQLRDNANNLLNGMTYTSRLRDDGLSVALAALDAARVAAAADDLAPAVASAAGALRVQMASATSGLVDIEYTDFLENWDIARQRFIPWSKYTVAAFILAVIIWTGVTGYCTILFDQASTVSASLAKIDIVGFSEGKGRLYAQAQRDGFDTIKPLRLGETPSPIQPAPLVAQSADSESKSAALVTFIHDLARLEHDYQAIKSVVDNAQEVALKISAILSKLEEMRAITFATVADLFAAITASPNQKPTRQAALPSMSPCPADSPSDPACQASGLYNAGAAQPLIWYNSASRRIDDFLQASGVEIDIIIPKLVPYLETLLRYQMRVLGMWLLPAFYGTLGAGIFYLRRLLRANLPNPPIGRVMTRMVLGGLAGVLVASVWTTPMGNGQNLATLSAFMLAFLFGYSIDIFFRLLDRLVYSIQKQIDQIDAPAAGK